MGGEWKNFKLGSIAKVLSGFAFKSSDMGVEGSRIVKIKNIVPPNVDLADCQRVAESVINANPRAEKFRLEAGDILIAMTGATVGKVARFPEFEEPCFLNQRVGKVFINDSLKTDARFVYYILSQDVFVSQMFGLADGSAQANISGAQIEGLTIPLPPLPEQRAIAHILGSLDDKIELNRKQNATLEEMAQALFQSWFVDFDPVIDKALAAGHEIPEPLQAKARRRAALGERRKPLPAEVLALFPDSFVETAEMGWVPEGWVPSRLDEMADVIGGATPSTQISEYFTENGIPWLSPKDLSGYNWKFISRGATDITAAGLKNSSARLMPKGTVLFSSRAPIGYQAIAENEITTNQGFKSLVPKDGIGTAFLYAFLKTQTANIESIATGSTFKEISGTAMKSFPILAPPLPLVKAFEQQVGSNNERQLLLQKETESLTQLRDTLLPKLISGELRLGEVAQGSQ